LIGVALREAIQEGPRGVGDIDVGAREREVIDGGRARALEHEAVEQLATLAVDEHAPVEGIREPDATAPIDLYAGDARPAVAARRQEDARPTGSQRAPVDRAVDDAPREELPGARVRADALRERGAARQRVQSHARHCGGRRRDGK
jgi:hypothetical protein